MTGRDDFEHRLSQGLKRWAQAGEPTVDLESFVRERMGHRDDGAGALRWNGAGAPTGARGTEATARHLELGAAPVGRRSRRWRSWLGGVAAAAVIALALGLNFPRWVGAAADLPLVGPVITRMIMEDAGLKWAYDMGLIRGNVAEVTQGGITVRILGVVADARRTTVIYQVQGVPPSEAEDSPPTSHSWFETAQKRPSLPVEVIISGAVTSSSPPEETPLGYMGTVSTLPLETQEAELELTFLVNGETITLSVPASREETDRFSREVVVNQTLEHDGVRITVESVTYTPAETVVRYREEGERFMAPVQWDWKTHHDYLEVDGRRYRESLGTSFGVNNILYKSFPPVEGPARLVFKPAVKGSPIDAVWPLEEGAVVEVMGVPITLAEYDRTADAIGFRWVAPAEERFAGIAGFEVIDTAGNAYPLGGSWESVSNYVADGVRNQHYAAELPAGVEPVAVRATRAGVLVEGPWVFELPR